MLTDNVLMLSSKERFIEAANFKHRQLLIKTTDEGAKKANATLVSVTPYKMAPYTAIVSFDIDRTVNGVPYGCVAPTKQHYTRTVYIRQLTADDIIDKFGIRGTLYLGLKGATPATTDLLASQFKARFGLNISSSDIISDEIGNGATCVLVRFAKTSVGFTGALRVDLTTPVYDDQTPPV